MNFAKMVSIAARLGRRYVLHVRIVRRLSTPLREDQEIVKNAPLEADALHTVPKIMNHAAKVPIIATLERLSV